MTGEPEDASGPERTRSRRFARSRLFSVRLWKERIAGGSEYRGSVRDVVSGELRNFREWPDLVAFMIERVEEDEPGRSEPWEAMT